MAGSVNRVILVGNVVADVVMRTTQDGRRIGSFRLATSDQWRDKHTGERKEKAEFHNVVVFNEGICKVVEQYVKKGAKLYIEGALQTRKWQDQNGNDRYSTEVVLNGFNCSLTMLDGGTKSDRENDRDDYGARDSGKQKTRQQAPASSYDDIDDSDIPF